MKTLCFAAVLFVACDTALVGDENANQTSAFSVLVEEAMPTTRDPPVPATIAQSACSFRARMEALMRNLSTCWMRDSYVDIVMDIVCPMDGLHEDITKKLHTLVTCHGLEVLEADGSLWYRWPDVETRQAAIDAAVALKSKFN